MENMGGIAVSQQDINRAQECLMRGRGIKKEIAELRQRKEKKRRTGEEQENEKDILPVF